MLKSNLLATKLHQPPLPARWIQRPQLSQRLQEGLDLKRQMTLVSAPAGFGKTTCISEWLNGMESWPVSWLSLDPADDDPQRFFAYLVAALQKVDANLGEEIEGVLRAGQLPPAEMMSTTLLNDITAGGERFILVLDDFHVIQEQFILQVLEQVIVNLPPLLHLVLLTREDPPLSLGRLRANNLLTEIRARDLRFNDHDAGRFLNEAMGLSLSSANVSKLEEKTEGWIVGLQLAAIALQEPQTPRSPLSGHEPTDIATFIATLSGSHRFILSYLTEQVLDLQPAEIRQFLLQTAILDKLNSDLCDAVTGRADSRALLERLLKANLFLVPVDDEGQWYRYHHLFADLLRELQHTLQEGETVDLHRRASQWYRNQDGAFVNEAMAHALAAADYEVAVTLLEMHALALIMQGYAQTVNSWVQAIPQEWRSQRPRTDLAFAWMHLLRGAYDQASPYLERAHSALTASEREEEIASLRAQWLVMRSLVLQMEAKLADSERLAREALATAPEWDADAHSLAYFALGSVLRLTEAYSDATDAYRMAIQRARAADNSVAEMLSTVGLAGMAFEHGRLQLAFEIAEPVIARIERAGSLPPISSVLYGVLGEIHYQWHQLEKAWHYSRRALQLSALGGYNSGQIFCRVLLCRLAQIEGDLERAARELGEVADLVPAQLPDYVRQELVAQQVRVYLARNRPDAARLALQGEGYSFGQAPSFGESFSFPQLPPDGSISHAAGLLYNSSLRVLLYQARAGHALATLRCGLALADRVLTRAIESEYLLVTLETLLLRAQMRAMLGNGWIDGAESDYASALKLAEPEGIVAVFVEQGPPVAEALADMLGQNQLERLPRKYVEHIITLARAQEHWPDPTPGAEAEALVEPLTDRELEVLRLIADGLRYKEIGTQLFISLNTVRFHVKAIYSKLGVNKRTQAVKKAHHLHIL